MQLSRLAICEFLFPARWLQLLGVAIHDPEQVLTAPQSPWHPIRCRTFL